MAVEPEPDQLARLIAAKAKADDAIKQRESEDVERRDLDVVDWGEAKFYIPETRSPIRFLIHQAAVLRYALRRLTPDDSRIRQFPSLTVRQGYFPFRTVLWSTPKKRGKSTVAAVVGRYVAETQSRFGEVYHCGHDLEQAKERSFKFISDSVRMTPGCVQRGGDWVLPEQWIAQKTRQECVSSGTIIKAVSTDARGEAGANPDLTIWTELWTFIQSDDILFWQEMKPVPAKPDSMRWVETYAGFENESTLLYELYERGKAGTQLTAGQLSEATGAPLDAFAETEGDPDALVPVWVNEGAGLLMYWDSGLAARRLLPHEDPEIAAAYYREEEQQNTPAEYRRHHLNEWVGAESDFIPMPLWDICSEPWDAVAQTGLPPFLPGDPTQAVLAADAATTGDCFGLLIVTRHPQRHDDVAVRALRKWDPKEEGGIIDYWGPESFIRTLCKGGCALGHFQGDGWRLDPEGAEKLKRPVCEACRHKELVPPYKIVQLAYDSYQLVDMMQRLTREQVVWCNPFDQGKERSQADRALYDLIVNRQLAHDGNLELREHIQNSKARLQRDEDSKLRIVKKAPQRKIDLVVCLSMAALRCKYLLLK